MMTDNGYAGAVLEDGIAVNVEDDAGHRLVVAVSGELMADDLGPARGRYAAQVAGSGVDPES